MNIILLILSIMSVGQINGNRYEKIFKNKYNNFMNIAKKNLNKLTRRIELHNDSFMYLNSYEPYEVFFINSNEDNYMNAKDSLVYLKIFNNFKNMLNDNNDFNENNLSMGEYFILPW